MQPRLNERTAAAREDTAMTTSVGPSDSAMLRRPDRVRPGRLAITLAVLLAGSASLAPAAATAAPEDGTKVKLAFVPCVSVGEDDAGGELEWESDTRLLKVEIWGATDYAGETMILSLNDVPIGSIPVGIGTINFEAASFDLPASDTGYSAALDYSGRSIGLITGLVFSSDRDCDRD